MKRGSLSTPWLGDPGEDKRHALLQGGHLPPDLNAIVGEVLDRLGRDLDPLDRR